MNQNQFVLQMVLKFVHVMEFLLVDHTRERFARVLVLFSVLVIQDVLVKTLANLDDIL